MRVEIAIDASFFGYVRYDAKEYCGMCSFQSIGLCNSVKDLHKRCQHGTAGYWVFNDLPKGNVINGQS